MMKPNVPDEVIITVKPRNNLTMDVLEKINTVLEDSNFVDWEFNPIYDNNIKTYTIVYECGLNQIILAKSFKEAEEKAKESKTKIRCIYREDN